LEIYNEEIQDLLDTSNTRLKLNNNIYNKNPITIREEKDGSISVYGINEEKVILYEVNFFLNFKPTRWDHMKRWQDV